MNAIGKGEFVGLGNGVAELVSVLSGKISLAITGKGVL